MDQQKTQKPREVFRKLAIILLNILYYCVYFISTCFFILYKAFDFIQKFLKKYIS